MSKQLQQSGIIGGAFGKPSISGKKVNPAPIGQFTYIDKDSVVSDGFLAFTNAVSLNPAQYPELAKVIPPTGFTNTPQTTLNNPTPAATDLFGNSVSISGDYAIVGAYYDDTNATDAGSAYIYVRSGTTWTLQATLNNPSPNVGDLFGQSVAISGDYAIVGVPNNLVGSGIAGSVYIYVRSDTTWSLQATLNNTSADVSAFGSSVSISGDYAIVGANATEVGGIINAGSAYIYFRSGTTWSLQATLNNPSPADFDSFGISVSISGDYAIVGAYFDDTGATDAGSAYIYVRSGTTWTLQATLNNPTPVASDLFGNSVSISGNYVIVGAVAKDITVNNEGSAYIYVRSGTSWSLQATLNNPIPNSSDSFGSSVSISGDYAIVGADVADASGATDSGRAYIYVRSGTSWSLQTTLNNPIPGAQDFFGYSVSISGDYAIVGAYYDDTVASNAGSAYIYSAGDNPAGQIVLYPLPSKENHKTLVKVT